MLEAGDCVDCASVDDVQSSVALEDDLDYVPVVEFFEVAVFDLSAGGGLFRWLGLRAGWGVGAGFGPSGGGADVLAVEAGAVGYLDAAYSADQEEVADVALFDLALGAGGPDFVFADETVEEAVVALAEAARDRTGRRPTCIRRGCGRFRTPD